MRVAFILFVVAAGFGTLLGMAVAQDNNAVIHACVHEGSRVIRHLDGPDQCRKGEQPLSWNVRGPQGPQGPPGPEGPQGPPGPGPPSAASRLAACHQRIAEEAELTFADCDREALLAP